MGSRHLASEGREDVTALYLDLHSFRSDRCGRLARECESTGISLERDGLAKQVGINEMDGYHIPELSPTQSDILVRNRLSVVP